MKWAFEKWHGTGNDFIMISDPEHSWPAGEERIRQLCQRRTGIGADGLIVIRKDPEVDFRMIYYNSDGRESTMCGNGGRCALAFAAKHGFYRKRARFRAIDGLHEGFEKEGLYHLKMNDVSDLREMKNQLILDTGSPHLVRFAPVESEDFVQEAAAIRWSGPFALEGINVNFVEELGTGHLRMRTFERGVEDETLSCGTGAVAAAIAAAHNLQENGPLNFELETRGGTLKVTLEKEEDQYHNVWLIGPAVHVYNGELDI